ncbi:hypothetical protein SAY87_024435 [Trapa incisa]|uniref:O-fucosyltransferase family protein n=1 Tax=Trapa incisa TaxID=236973 RepID=A0AAN7GQ09_9MYRT|nr:hypothetical protein SAY87_024435 [Trapa incisa]
MAIGKATVGKALPMKVTKDCCIDCQVCGGSAVGGTRGSGSTSPSPPLSPPRRRARLLRPRSSTTFVGILLRRPVRYLVALPLMYFSGLIMCVGPFSSLVGLFSPQPGSVYRSHLIFQKLWPDIVLDNSSSVQLESIWTYKMRLKEQKPCINTTGGRRFLFEGGANEPNGYLIVEANGGLNQQRSAICNAVALAGLLNAVLVIPRFELNSVWKDPSEFGDIYDEDHFISTLEGHVKVVRVLPEELMEQYNSSINNIPNLRVQAWASANYYIREVYPILKQQGVIRIVPFANRLSMSVPPHIQFLRCLANYKAVKFSPAISELANMLVSRMIEKSSMTGGKYASVHLRFEEDMVAFSFCEYDGGRAEKIELDLMREKGWGRKFKRNDRTFSPRRNRIDGKCPLTPLEVGMMLRGMGFDNNTSIYLASGKIYHAERYLAPLLKMFPLIYSKESLASPEELAPFKAYSSRLAALDYIVCLMSEVFVTTQGGNFPHFLMGHRRFINGGHSKTINPDKQKLVLLLHDADVSWKNFKLQMAAMLQENDRKGMIIPRVKKFNRKTSIYKFPLPECGCLQRSNNLTASEVPLSSHALY